MGKGAVVVRFVKTPLFKESIIAIFAMSKKRKVSQTFKGTRELLEGEPWRLIERRLEQQQERTRLVDSLQRRR